MTMRAPAQTFPVPNVPPVLTSPQAGGGSTVVNTRAPGRPVLQQGTVATGAVTTYASLLTFYAAVGQIFSLYSISLNASTLTDAQFNILVNGSVVIQNFNPINPFTFAFPEDSEFADGVQIEVQVSSISGAGVTGQATITGKVRPAT